MTEFRDNFEVIHAAANDETIEGALRLGMSMLVLTITPEDVQWLNERLPGWKDHISAKRFDVQGLMPKSEAYSSAVGAEDRILMMRTSLARKLADAIVDTAPAIDLELLD